MTLPTRYGMTAGDVMNPSPDKLHPDETIACGIELIMEHRYRALPVVDSDGVYLGVFGVNCLLRLVLPKAVQIERGLTSVPFVSATLADLRQRLKTVESQPVSTCMNRDVETVTPDTPLLETLLVLYRTRSSIPVVDSRTGCLEGMISYWDVGSKVLEQELSGSA